MRTCLRTLSAALLALAIAGTTGCEPPPEPPPQGGGVAPAQQGGGAAPDGPPVVAVKIDNAPEGRPPVGVEAADLVYVEPVEGGLSRILAIFSTHKPDVVGPVRSARETDAEILPQYGRPTLAYSGAAPEVLPTIAAAPLTDASDKNVPGAYSRDEARPSPHNLFVNTNRLPPGQPWPGDSRPLIGEALPGGAPTERYEVRYPAASVGFFFNHEDRRWMVSMDGEPYAAVHSGRLGVATVIIQEVRTHESVVRDAAGNASPVAETIGSGPARVLRDGTSVEGTWNRPSPEAPTTYADRAGSPIPVAAGQVWIVLDPK
ncbi:DUF3048 domain-containing protein [Saccharopolyspora rhizosphaerae]|uniref:DUF3048 domain-containing protein n=1 Tax=Saccharopolyspora rhizosphaerae TaxID=2492662 RepID=A0A426K4P1_9PSEU|nr:DUF3048 domain-containing protein [Saccharopolyspora rhizosphaerae]RRO20395.1 DUF3048 domain-containing protein [Saccharopolyspora rhizosphaerae]